MGYVNNVFASLLLFEKYTNRIRMFSSAKCAHNQLFILLYGISSELAICFKNSLNGFFLSLLDITGVDISKLKNYKLFFNMSAWAFDARHCSRLTYYNLLDYKTSQRVILTCFSQPGAITLSIENVFLNANWVERELVEFFGTNIYGRTDTRNLLLDYNLQVNPLLKTYPTEGHQELFFNYLSYNLEYVNTEFVEL